MNMYLVYVLNNLALHFLFDVSIVLMFSLLWCPCSYYVSDEDYAISKNEAYICWRSKNNT
jgi:hypothetical protein